MHGLSCNARSSREPEKETTQKSACTTRSCYGNGVPAFRKA
jgi:hypothetical protein